MLVYTARLPTTRVSWKPPFRIAYPNMSDKDVERILAGQAWVHAQRAKAGLPWLQPCWKVEDVDFAELAERAAARVRYRRSRL